MKLPRNRHAHLAVAIAAALLNFVVAIAPAHADAVSDWVGLADRALDGRPLAPPLQAQRERTAPALTALAIFEAVNAIDRRYQSYLDLARAEASASQDAAAIAAGHGVLTALYPERRGVLDDARAIALAHIAPGAARDAGEAVGGQAAQRALARTLFEGHAPTPYRAAGEPGAFVNPEPPLIPPWALRAQFFFLASADEAMPAPPPALTSARYARDVEETRRMGGVREFGATPDTLRRARFLAGFSLDPMVRRAMEERSPVERARFFALVRMAQHDANAMINFSKIRYRTWRPITAIRNADLDGNPRTTRDLEWTPVMATPNHPEYPCGHCTMSALMSALLAPYANGPIEVASESAPLNVAMVFANWRAFDEAASLARIEGGVHFRFSNEAGQAMGRRVAALAQTRFAPPIAAAIDN
jgi:hypothetical protein